MVGVDEHGGSTVSDGMQELDPEVEEALRLQDEALVLLERLRAASTFRRHRTDHGDQKRRNFRRWPIPPGVAIELHDGNAWQAVHVLDLGVGGARVDRLPDWMRGPAPCRLNTPSVDGIVVLADIMWRTGPQAGAGIRFEFDDAEEREAWQDGLIDALLATHAVN